MSERKTESFVDKKLEIAGYKEINYQGSEDPLIQRLLKSKGTGRSGRGRPEYTIKLNGIASDVLVVECKKEKADHHGPNAHLDSFTELDIQKLSPKDYAVDGVIHYMKSLADGNYNVVGLAISGTDPADLEISTFVTRAGRIERTNHKTILAAKDYVDLLKKENYEVNADVVRANIRRELPIIHNELRDKMKLSEQEKPLLISACMLALKDEAFKSGYMKKSSPKSLASYTYSTIDDTLRNLLEIPGSKVDQMMSHFKFIQTNENVTNHLMATLHKVCFLFDNFNFETSSHDIIGDFYNEFLKYTGGDKQGLGIVLTPNHITDLFCELAEVNSKSVVMDTCTGTGAFLIAAMKKMVEMAAGDQSCISEIKKKQLVGVEQNGLMFTLACSNMILRNDGKSNMFKGSCFSSDVKELIRPLKPNVCLINPPYSQKDDNESELAFIRNALDLLEPNGKLVAIVPISSGIEMSTKKIEQRRTILKSHTLDAVFSMPDELFYPVGTNTCVMVFTSHKPHGADEAFKVGEKDVGRRIKASKPTYFGYWKDDGFSKTKTLGRCDREGKWSAIREEWLESFRMRKVENGRSALKAVSELDEWCCEAHMAIDYDAIGWNDFQKEVAKYLAFQIVNPVMVKANPKKAQTKDRS